MVYGTMCAERNTTRSEKFPHKQPNRLHGTPPQQVVISSEAGAAFQKVTSARVEGLITPISTKPRHHLGVTRESWELEGGLANATSSQLPEAPVHVSATHYVEGQLIPKAQVMDWLPPGNANSILEPEPDPWNGGQPDCDIAELIPHCLVGI